MRVPIVPLDPEGDYASPRTVAPITSLDQHRLRKVHDEGKLLLLTCPCGSQWFDAKVCIENGRVTGYAVPVTCISCGQEVVPT